MAVARAAPWVVVGPPPFGVGEELGPPAPVAVAGVPLQLVRGLAQREVLAVWKPRHPRALVEFERQTFLSPPSLHC